MMFESSELGPLDAQIVKTDDKGNLISSFSALSVKAANNKIKEEIKAGNIEYAKIIADRMPDSVETAELENSLSIGKKYLRELLLNRMFNKISPENKRMSEVGAICKKLVEGYSHHGYVIDAREAKNNLRLNIVKPDNAEKQLITDIHGLHLKWVELMKMDKLMNIAKNLES